MAPRVFAIAAHADDIEFGMAGTMLLLARAGCELHYMNVANGSCGSAEHDAETTAATRLGEAKAAAARMGATFHPPLVPDLEIFYEHRLLARLAFVVRSVAPEILLVPSPQDYMEDHTNTCRLAVSAAFCRGMRNFPTSPPHPPISGEVTIYHAQPHGNRDALNQPVKPDFCVDIGDVIEEKAALLADHKSQKEWLDRSQGMNAYLNTMKDFSREMGRIADTCEYAEGWRRHNPLGLCAAEADPLRELLGDCVFSQSRDGAAGT